RPCNHCSDFSAKQLHSENIARLASHIFCAHVDDALQSKHRANRRRGDSVLTCASLGNDAALAHSPRKQGLAHRIVDLVRTSVGKIFTLQVDLCSARVRSQPLRVNQRRWPAAVIAKSLVKFAPEIRITSRARELFR